MFIITGFVREKESGVGLLGLVVRAYNKALFYDDLIGEAQTSYDGRFEIVSPAKDFRDFYDTRPDISLRIMVVGPGGVARREICNPHHAVSWNTSSIDPIVIDVPKSIALELPNKKIEYSHEHDDGAKYTKLTLAVVD